MQSMPINRMNLTDTVIILKNMTGVSRTRHTISNWCINGRLSYSKTRVFLGHEVIFGRIYTTKADLRKFIEELRI